MRTIGFQLLLATLLATASVGMTQAQPPAAPERPPALVATAPVIEREVTAGQIFVGTIEPLKTVTIGSATDGRVVEFPLREGQRVKEGETVAQLLTATIQLEIATAKAELDLRQQELAEMQNGSRPGEIEQARARMAAAEATHAYMVARRDRNESAMRTQGAVTNDEFELSIADAKAAEEAVLEARATLQLALDGPRSERIAQAKARLAMQQAVVERLEDQLGKHTVIARFDGYVTAEHTEVGAWLKQGDPVADVVAIDEVDVVAQVTEQAVPFVQLGAEVRVEVPALNRVDLVGHVAAIVPQADLRARTFPVKVRLKNELQGDVPLLKAGMFARVALPVGQSIRATLVPKDALVLGGASPKVYVVDAAAQGSDAPTTARPVPVQIGVATDHWMQVTGPLEPGALVVVRGNERLLPMPQPVRIDQQYTAQQIDEFGFANGTRG